MGDIINLQDTYGANNYKRLPVAVSKSVGSWVYDLESIPYLDGVGSFGCNSFGHHHPIIVKAMTKALVNSYASVIGGVMYSKPLSLYLERLANFVPLLGVNFKGNHNKVMVKNGGGESAETAVKCMRAYGHKALNIPDGRQEILVFDRSFHGRGITLVSSSSNAKYKEGFGPLTRGFKSVPFGDLDKAELALSANTCGILVEAFQGDGGPIDLDPTFLQGLRKLCDAHHLLLIFDEIQVGLGRTGKMFGFQHADIVPDGIILGKALGGGLAPLSAFVTNSTVMDLVFQPGTDGSMYGGSPLTCVAGLAVLKVLEYEKLVSKSRVNGALLLEAIQAIESPHVKSVTGVGLFIRIEVKSGANEICEKLLDLNVIVACVRDDIIRISPSLNISHYELDFLIKQLIEVLGEH